MSMKSCPISKIIEFLSLFMILLMDKVNYCSRSSKQGWVRSILYKTRYKIKPIVSKKTGRTRIRHEGGSEDFLSGFSEEFLEADELFLYPYVYILICYYLFEGVISHCDA